MNYTKAKIFNMTLKNLGISTGIQSASQGDRNTVVLQEFYENALFKTLNDYDWGFASTYSDLTPTLDKNIHPRFSYSYDYPNNCLKIRELFLRVENNFYQFQDDFLKRFFKIEYEIASDKNGNKIIFTDVTPAIARYTCLITNESLFPPEFAIALSWYLAFLTASAITGTRSKTADCMQIYKQMINEAAKSDANEQSLNNGFIDDYSNARD